jgi:HlyD family secretion protein
MRMWMGLFIACLLVLGLGGWYWRHNSAPAALFRTAPVARGDLLATISATGTLEPEQVVDVGAQIAGQIEYFGKDPHHPDKAIDYGSEVEQGTMLAHIDDSLYTADVITAQANVEQARANVTKAQADLGTLNAKLFQAQADWKRAQQAGHGAGLSDSDLDTYKANADVAEANLADGNAAIDVAKMGLAAAQATLDRAKKNLSYCTIISPVKGTIIDRRVNIGQTVVAALDAPSLFLIAKDLTKMQVWASVNEADIANIHPGQAVTFTVDAMPGVEFKGTVNKRRDNATMTQNVVTYTVEINTDNSDGKLLPYLTANVKFEVERRTGVLMVPNAALRWTPQTQQVAPDVRKANAQNTGDSTSASGDHKQNGVLWVQDGAYVRPIQVGVGLSDGMNTQVSGEGVDEGTRIVLGDADSDDTGGGSNPFVPQFGKPKK